MIIQNTYIPPVSLNDVAYVLAKKKNSDELVKVPVSEIQGELVIEIVQFMGKVIPSGLLLCDGKMYHKDNFEFLYEVIGSHFSKEGDPPDTFRVPDLVTGNRFLLSGDCKLYMPANKDGKNNLDCSYIYCEDNVLNHSHGGIVIGTLDAQSRGGAELASFSRLEDKLMSYTGSSETAGKNIAVNFCIRTGPISEKGLERGTTDGQIRETTYSEVRIVTFSS